MDRTRVHLHGNLGQGKSLPMESSLWSNVQHRSRRAEQSKAQPLHLSIFTGPMSHFPSPGWSSPRAQRGPDFTLTEPFRRRNIRSGEGGCLPVHPRPAMCPD
jgi:hypothetical protein